MSDGWKSEVKVWRVRKAAICVVSERISGSTFEGAGGVDGRGARRGSFLGGGRRRDSHVSRSVRKL